MTDFGILPQTSAVISDGLIADASGLKEYTIPSGHYTPDVRVYFDFLRRTTAPINVLSRKGAETNPIDFQTLASDDSVDNFATEQAKKKVEFYYNNFSDYFQTRGTTDEIPFFGDVYPEDSTLKGKQHFINGVLAHFLYNVTVSRTNAGPSTASVSFTYEEGTPRNKVGTSSVFSQVDDGLFWNHFFENNKTGDFTVLDQLISPHTWIYIYARGRMDPTAYYPIFTGFTNTVTDSNDGGFASISVTCEDTLKLLHRTQVRLNPAIADPLGDKTTKFLGENFSPFAFPYSGLHLRQIVEILLEGKSVTDPKGAGNVTAGGLIYPPQGVLDYKMLDPGDFQQYYDERPLRFGNVASPDDRGVATAIYSHRQFQNNKPKIVFWGLDNFTPYKALLPMRQPNIFQNDFGNRYEALRDATNRSMVEFYADAMGHYNLHPYRHSPTFLTQWALDDRTGLVFLPDKSHPTSESETSAYVLSPEEILTSAFTLSDEDVLTALGFQGEFSVVGPLVELASFLGGLRDLATVGPLMSRFGFWYDEHREPNVNEGVSGKGADPATGPGLIRLFALARLAYNNKDIYTGQITAEFRPELEVARPVYLPHRRDIGYITGLDHNFTAGQAPTTGIALSFCRKTDSLPIDFNEFLVQRRENFGNITPDRLNVLLPLFEAAAGLQRLPNLSLSPQAVGAIQSTDTLNYLVAHLSKSYEGDHSQFLKNLADQNFVAGLEP